MSNPFDQFDDKPTKSANPFDRFDGESDAIFQPAKDLWAPIKAAGAKIAADIADDNRRTSAANTPGAAAADLLPGLGRSARNAANLLGVVPAALAGVTDAIAVGPAARLLSRVPGARGLGFDPETNKQMIATALMGLKPGPASSTAFAMARPPIPAAPARADLRVGQALRRAVARDMQQPVDVIAAADAAPTAPAFHAGGQNLQSLADIVANSPGPGSRIIKQAVREHQAQATDRVMSEVATGLGGKGDYLATVDALQEARKAQAQPLLEKAFSAPIGSEVYSAEVAPIMARMPRGALEQAVDIARRDGRAPEELGFVTRRVPGGGSVDVQVSNPTLETLHYVKKGLDQSLEQYRNPVTGALDLTGSPGAQADSRVRSALGRTMREINPEYDQAMQLWGDDSERLRALALGRDVFSPKFDMQAEGLGRQLGKMSEAARDLFRKGVGEAVLAQARSTKGGVGAARSLLKSREFGDRVRLAFPTQKSFDDFMLSLDREVTLQDQSNRIMGGSPTDPRQAARADLERQATDPVDVLGGVVQGGLDPRGLAGKAAKAAIKAIPRKDRSIIGDAHLNEAAARALIDRSALQRALNAPSDAAARRAAISRRASELARRLGPPALAWGQKSGR